MIQKVPQNRMVRKQTKPMDKAFLGMIAGFIFTMIGLILVFFILHKGITFSDYMQLFYTGEPSFAKASKSLNWAVMCNLIPFYFFINRKMYQGTKGVIIATAVLLILSILYKFVW